MKELEAGQKLIIRFKTSSVQTESITCTVKWFEKDRVALVLPDTHKRFARVLPMGKELEAIIYTDAGVYVFDSIVINSPLEHDFVIELPDEKKRIQRRDYVRVHFNLKMLLSKRDKEIEASTVNIGGGGIRFVLKEELKTNDVWGFTLHLPDNTMIKGKGQVLYSILQGQLMVSIIKFVDINEIDRNKIIKKCFEEELKKLQIAKNS
jgi:c-di-GMP-binding flagellar brake protein YcgR